MPPFLMPGLSITDAVRIPDAILFRELNGEAVLLNLESGTYFGLDAVGTRIWQLCEAYSSIEAVWDVMQGEFDAPAEALKTDLLVFVNELSSKGLLTRQ